MCNRKDIDANDVLICCMIFINVFNIITVDAISWTKYRFDGNSVEATCPLEDVTVIADDVPDPLSCSKMCYLHDKCPSSFFKPENHQCIGCRVFLKGAPILTSDGSVQYSNRDFKIDCKEILELDRSAVSGVYEIRLRNSKKIPVYCDMTTDGGGWTVFQNRFDGSADFAKTTLKLYEDGFGDVNGEFWLGLRYVQELTESPTELWYSLSVMSGETAHEQYDRFELVGKTYRLSIDVQPVEKSGLAASTGTFLGSLDRNEFTVYDPVMNEHCGGWWGFDYECVYLNFNKGYSEGAWYYNAVQSKLNTSRMMLRRK